MTVKITNFSLPQCIRLVTQAWARPERGLIAAWSLPAKRCVLVFDVKTIFQVLMIEEPLRRPCSVDGMTEGRKCRLTEHGVIHSSARCKKQRSINGKHVKSGKVWRLRELLKLGNGFNVDHRFALLKSSSFTAGSWYLQTTMTTNWHVCRACACIYVSAFGGIMELDYNEIWEERVNSR